MVKNNLDQLREEEENINPLETEKEDEKRVEGDKKKPKAFEGPELSLQEKARYQDLIVSIDKMKVIDDLDTHLPNVDPRELTRDDLNMLEKYLKIRRAGFKQEAVSAFFSELNEIQLKPDEQESAPHSFLAHLRTKVSYQASEGLKKIIENKELRQNKDEKVKTEYQKEKLDDFWTQFNGLKKADPNEILQKINVKLLGDDERWVWKKFKQFTHEGWPKIRIPEFKRLLSEHESIVEKLSTKKGEADKAMSIKFFIEYLGEEVDKEVEKSEA